MGCQTRKRKSIINITWKTIGDYGSENAMNIHTRDTTYNQANERTCIHYP